MGGPNASIWVPCLVVAHICVALLALRSWLIQKRVRKDPTADTSDGLDKAMVSEFERDVELAQAVNGNAHHKDQSPAGVVTAGNGLPSKNSNGRYTPCLEPVLSLPEPGQRALAAVPPCLVSEAVTLEWQAVGCSYNAAGGTRVVLQDAWGKAFPGQMQALMGPSGAGKSTLMDILAMRKSLGNLTGNLMVNGRPASASFIKHTSYVPQEDTFIPTMTCRETLAFYGGVGLGGERWAKRGSRRQRVDDVLAAVGLAGAADTIVGGTLPGGLQLRGLSGGERRRLSIAAGILGAPSVLFLDEPTSGLDSFAALSVMAHLKHVALTTHQTVVATIHQPRSAIWEMFDTVSLLASGRLMFYGSCPDMIPWFQGLGYSYTKGSEPDWVLDLIAIGFDKPVHLFGHTMRTRDDVDDAADAFRQNYIKVQDPPSSSSSDCRASDVASKEQDTSSGRLRGVSLSKPSSLVASTAKSVKGSLRGFQSRLSYPTSWWRQFTALYGREIASMTRNPSDVATRVLSLTYVALLYGLLAYNVNYTGLDGFTTRNNILFTAIIITLLVPYLGISLYTADKQLYIADASARRYSVTAYLVAKVLATAPFNILSTLLFCGVFYGMAGLRPGNEYWGRFACIITLLQLVGTQVLHLAAVISPNQDTTFALAITWTCVQLSCSSYYISFTQVYMYWLTQLRYISAAYFAIEGLVQNEFRGSTIDCADGLSGGLLNAVSQGLTNASPLQKIVLEQLKQPQPGCTFNQDAMVNSLDFTRPFGMTAGIMAGYWGVLLVLTYLGLLLLARKERR